MIVKQIDMQTALKLAAAGKEIKLLCPSGPDSSWTDMMLATLQGVLEGCLFFRPEPAIVDEEFEESIQEAEKEPLEPIIADIPTGNDAGELAPLASKAKRGGAVNAPAPNRKRLIPANYMPCIMPDGVRQRLPMRWESARQRYTTT